MFTHTLGIIAIICGGAMIGVIESGTPTGVWYKLIAISSLASGGYLFGLG